MSYGNPGGVDETGLSGNYNLETNWGSWGSPAGDVSTGNEKSSYSYSPIDVVGKDFFGPHGVGTGAQKPNLNSGDSTVPPSDPLKDIGIDIFGMLAAPPIDTEPQGHVVKDKTSDVSTSGKTPPEKQGGRENATGNAPDSGDLAKKVKLIGVEIEAALVNALVLSKTDELPGIGLEYRKEFEDSIKDRKAAIAASKGLTTAEQLAQRGVTGYTNHGVQRAAIERGFTDERVLKVISEGESVVKTGRYGTDQIRYTLGQNTVVVETGGRNAGKVITTFSPAEGGVWVEP